MRSFKEITRQGRMRRLRKVARTALDAYGLSEACLTCLCYNGNIIFRVDGPDSSPVNLYRTRYKPHRYVLRVHMVYHPLDAIESELQWLTALRRDADLPVPEPVPTEDGRLVTTVDDPILETARHCSLLRWLDGRFVRRGLNAGHVRLWGQLMARMHGHAAQWRPPTGFTRRRRDWAGMFDDGAGFEFPVEEVRAAIPPLYREPFEIVTGRLKQAMTELGEGPETFGLVHADLDVQTNVLFGRGEARAIDFDDCCFAYWMHDLAFALSPWQGTDDHQWIRDALLDGYTKIRTLPDSQSKHLDLFMAAFNANLMLWQIDSALAWPQWTGAEAAVNKYGNILLRNFAMP